MGQCCSSGGVAPGQARRKMGWKRDRPDGRDRTLALPPPKLADLPSKVDLRLVDDFPIYDQGQLGSCTANAIGAAFHFAQAKEGKRDFTPSRLFLYYNERETEGTVGEDSGAEIRDGMKVLNQLGICDEETLWPYEEAKFTVKPPDACYKEAAKNTAKEYARVPQTLQDLKGCLNEGFPFVLGFTVYSSFQSSRVALTGDMPMPGRCESVVGGHAVQACGYDDERQVFIVRNSWGSGWGDKGYFYMPYAYMTSKDLTSDLWTVRFVDGVDFPTT